MDLYISDAHLGSVLFNSESDLIKLIKDPIYKRIFFVGDTFDVWDEKFDRIRDKYHPIIAEINKQIKEGKEVVIIVGNHDPDASMIKLIIPQARILNKHVEDDVIIIHGHEFDGAILKVEWLNKLLYYLFIWPLHQIFKYDIRDKFRDMLYSPASRRGKRSYNKLVLQIEKDVLEKYQDDYNYIVMGHTHSPKIVNMDDGEFQGKYRANYINCGDWIHNKTYVIKDDDGNFHLEGKISGEQKV